MIYRFFFFLWFYVNFSTLVFNQSITGSIVDTRQNALPFATLSLFRLPDSTVLNQTSSDDKGFFSFTMLESGLYFVRATMIGFSPKSTPNFEWKTYSPLLVLAPISLEQLNSQLQTVTISAKKPLIEMQNSKLIVNVAGSSLAEGGTSLEVLERSPGISIDNDGTIFLKGKSAVRVFINGKPSNLAGADLATYLRGMPSNQLESIEIMSNPPAQFDAEGNAGVINLRLKKNQNFGTNGSINLSLGQGRLPKHNAGLSLNHRQAKTNLWVNYAFTYREDWTNSKIQRVFKADDQHFAQNFLAEYPNTIHNLRTGLDWDLNPKNTLAFSFAANSNQYKTLASNTSEFLTKSAQLEASTFTETRNEVKNRNATAGLHYRHLFKKEGESLSFDVDLSQFELSDRQHYNSRFNYFSDPRPPSQEILKGLIGADIQIAAFKTDYVRPFSKTLSLEAGLKSSFVRTENDVVFRNGLEEVDAGKSNNFRYRENLNAAYLSLSKSFKKFRLNLGLRTEQTIAKGYQVANDSAFSRKYWNIFPNLVLKHSLPQKQEISYSFSRRIDRPNYQDLNPFLFFFDNYTYVIGNSFLQPQLSSLWEVNYTHPKNIILTLNYGHTAGVMTRVIEQDDELKSIFQTVLNLNTFKNYGLALSFPLKFATFWQSNNSFNLYHNHYYGSYLNTPFDNRKTTLALSSIHNFNMSKGFSGEINLNYQSWVAYGIFRYVPTGTFSLGLQKSILKQMGSLRFNVRDIFYTQRRGADIVYQNMNIRVRHLVDSRFATLAFNYRFGNQKVVPARQRRTAAEEERRRIGQ